MVRQPAGGKDEAPSLSAALHRGRRPDPGPRRARWSRRDDPEEGRPSSGTRTTASAAVRVGVTEDVKAVGWAGLSVKLTFAAEPARTAKAGTKVGTLTVGDGTSSAVKVPVALQEDLVEPRLHGTS
ncbi:hypothetical protein TPAU25S_00897 [Tsukamurella paurometabola]